MSIGHPPGVSARAGQHPSEQHAPVLWYPSLPARGSCMTPFCVCVPVLLLPVCPFGVRRIAPEFLKGTKPDAEFDTTDAPLIVFINARSGGRVGPQLAGVLARAVGSAQVGVLARLAAAGSLVGGRISQSLGVQRGKPAAHSSSSCIQCRMGVLAPAVSLAAAGIRSVRVPARQGAGADMGQPAAAGAAGQPARSTGAVPAAHPGLRRRRHDRVDPQGYPAVGPAATPGSGDHAARHRCVQPGHSSCISRSW